MILDEPTNGLDVPSARTFKAAALSRMRDLGVCIVFSSHLIHDVSALLRHGGDLAGAAAAQSNSSLHVVAGKWMAAAVFAVARLALNLAGFTAVFEWSSINPPAGLTGPLVLI